MEDFPIASPTILPIWPATNILNNIITIDNFALTKEFKIPFPSFLKLYSP